MEIERILDEYRSGDEDRRMCLFLTHRELRDEFSLIDETSPVNQAAILCPPRFNHAKIKDMIFGFLGTEFRRPKSCCSFLAGAGKRG